MQHPALFRHTLLSLSLLGALVQPALASSSEYFESEDKEHIIKGYDELGHKMQEICKKYLSILDNSFKDFIFFESFL